MVASQSVEPQTGAPDHLYMHPAYGEYYPESAYYLPGHPELCPAHVCTIQGEYGPVTVPMVSTNSSPPIAMPVQVPPGHVVQQIVDENGTLRHVILSTSHHPPPPGLVPLPPPPQGAGPPTGPPPHQHNHQHYGPGNGTTQSQQFYAATGTQGLGYGGPGGALYRGGAGGGGGHAPSPASHAPSPPAVPHSYYRDERAQRQHIKLRRKLQDKQQKGDMQPRKELVNGLKRSVTKDKGMNSVGTSEDGEESSVPDEDDSIQIITDILSSVQAPKVSELSSRSALLQWALPMKLSESASNDSHEIDISESELRYEVLLSDKSKEMKFKSIYCGATLSCRIQDLRPGQEYSVCLQVHLDELQGSATDPIKFTTPPCEPDQPQPPKLIHRTKNSLQLKWNSVNDNGSPILHYILEYDEGKGGDFVEFYTGKGKTHTLQKLTPATAYKFRLVVVNEVGRSAYSESVTHCTFDNPPTQPEAPVLVEATVSSLNVKWQRRPKDEEFNLQMNDPKTKYGHMNVYNGRETSYVCEGLSCFSNYTFRLRVNSENGTSPWSEEVTYRTLPDRPGRPSKPVVKGRIHAYSFKLKWEPPNNTGGAEITKYILEVNSGSGYRTVYCGLDTEAVCDKLTPGTTYQLRVGCISAGGTSNYSDPCTVTTDAISPSQCVGLRLHGKPKANSITVRWVEPDYNGGAPVLDYEVEMLSPDSSRSLVHKSKETECTVNNLSPGCNYEFTTRAVNRIGPGPWSDPLKVTSGAASPDPPEIPSLQCKSPFHISVEWRESTCNGAPITEYRLEMSPEVGDDKFHCIYQGRETNYDLKGLTPFQTYYFRVQAGNSAGFSAYSPIAATITPAAPPAVVTTIRSESTPTSIALYWQAPASNGSEITHYNIEIGDRVVTTETPVTEYLIDKLQPEINYKIKIQAVNAVAAGAFSSTLKTSTLRLPPAAPTLECIGVGHNYLKLKWGEGKNTDYTQYCVEMENARSHDYQCVFKGTALTCKVNKLHESTPYRFRINASNDAGVGEFSNEYEFTTSIAPPSALKAPRVCEVDQRTCTIEWTPAKNSFTDPVVYHVQISRLKEQLFKQAYKGSEVKCTFENLEPGVEYCARVCPVRITPSEELQGPFSPVLNFASLAPEVSSAVTKLSTSTSSAVSHSHRRNSLYHSLWQMVSLGKFSEQYRIWGFALVITLFGIILSIGIGLLLETKD